MTLKFKPLTKDDVTFEVHCEPEFIEIRGNAIASGDPAVDKEVEDEVIRRLDSGDEWAWCSVMVRATWESPSGKTFSGEDYLGCCSYESKKAFIEAGDYYPDMCAMALDKLNDALQEVFDKLCEAL